MPITQDFTPTPDEMKLYESVSEYLQRPEAAGLPKSQRALMTLILRKILASSSFAIKDTLGALIKRLESLSNNLALQSDGFADELAQDYEAFGEMNEEWDEPEDADAESHQKNTAQKAQEAKLKLESIRQEISDLKDYKNLASSITVNAKAKPCFSL